MDAVIIWSDVDDPVYRVRRLLTLPEKRRQSDLLVQPPKMKGTKDIHYNVASLISCAPFIRRIFIVTNSEDKGLKLFLKRKFPLDRTPINFVSHKMLFDGFNVPLPVVDPVALESMIWKIPCLDDEFLLLDAGWMIVSPMEISDFVDGDKFILRGATVKKVPRRILRSKDRLRINAALACGADKYVICPESPMVLSKTFFEDFFRERPDLLELNITAPLGSPNQMDIPSLCWSWLLKEGRGVIRKAHGEEVAFNYDNDDDLVSQLQQYRGDNSVKFCDVPPLSSLGWYQQRTITDWLSERFRMPI